MKMKKKDKKQDAPVENDPEIVDPGEVDPEAILEHEDALAELEQQVGEWQAKYQRALADYQNYQRRAIANEAEARRQGSVAVINGLLGLADNVDRALQVDPEQATVDQIRQGVSVIRDELMQIMAAHAVTRVEPAEGDEFDPERHEALLQTPHPDVEPGRVVMTLQIGYAMGDRTLRPAKVSLAREPEGD